MNMNLIKEQAVLRMNRAVLLGRKHAPTILLVAGIAGTVVATVGVVNATSEAKDAYAAAKSALLALQPEENAEHEDVVKAVQAQTALVAVVAVDICKMYAPSMLLMLASMLAIIQSRSILNKRNAALLAAYQLTSETYKRYRARIIEEFGDELDTYLHSARRGEDQPKPRIIQDIGASKVEPFSVDAGNNILVTTSPYGKFFDESSPQWRTTGDANIFFLTAQQTYANTLLHARGHVFLNEIYDAIGIPRTSAGAIVGWVDNGGDGVIDFGIYNSVNDCNTDNADFVNGYDCKRLLLDFNVDGVIYDLIWLRGFLSADDGLLSRIKIDPDEYVYDSGYVVTNPKKGETYYVDYHRRYE